MNKMADSSIITKAINTVRLLAADTVERANSGHPGACTRRERSS